MPVAEDTIQHLMLAAQEARAAAAQAVARSQALVPVVQDGLERSLRNRLTSRPHQAFVRVEGMVEGHAVRAVVRIDGTVVATPSLLRRADLLVAMGERLHPDPTQAYHLTADHLAADHRADPIMAELGEDPLATSLTLVRACDRIIALEMSTPSSRSRGAPSHQ